ncbi:hypothetical protein Emtol_0312 (plasmid) [Emticicia oligotrophica DSM 17448]|uniref:Uncharacterized protein n=1 Tax=Emticicia oligotrophica (strain DSM 17448 / CIP 109782 / MTCC 6937 / GPTSA100-15) TaxID=929562 RepID=A0ABN4ASB4_EMTOG|nr:hypothetical protein [Emticicia oligotrophica]AFK05579.1 hypothetical protein Emtol_0312 [Emticicia oligotrophica DSM 17448]
MVVTRKYLIWALEKNIKTKNYLLYWFFQDLIDSALSSALVQKKISDELNCAIKKSQIETIRYRIPSNKLKAFKRLIVIEKEKEIFAHETITEQEITTFTDPFKQKQENESSFIKLIK